MPSILKRFTRPEAVPYQFPDAQSLTDQPLAPSLPLDSDDTPLGEEEAATQERAPEKVPDPSNPVEYAQVQADAILEEARQEAQRLLAQAKLDIEAELEELREAARQDGRQIGFAEGMQTAIAEGQQQRAQQAVELGVQVTQFLEKAGYAHDELLEQTQSELKELAIAIAEKIIRVSLKSSGEIVARMIQTATEKMKRKEWVHIYVADCDSKGIAKIAPQLTESLSYLSDHVKIVPMGDDESGTCIIETPDEIIDASTSTQISNIRDLLMGG